MARLHFRGDCAELSAGAGRFRGVGAAHLACWRLAECPPGFGRSVMVMCMCMISCCRRGLEMEMEMGILYPLIEKMKLYRMPICLFVYISQPIVMSINHRMALNRNPRTSETKPPTPKQGTQFNLPCVSASKPVWFISLPTQSQPHLIVHHSVRSLSLISLSTPTL